MIFKIDGSKRILLLIALMLTLIAPMAFGDGLNDQTFNILIYPANQEIQNFVQSFFPKITLTDVAIEARKERIVQTSMMEAGQALASAYLTEDSKIIENAKIAFEKSKTKTDVPNQMDLNILSLEQNTINLSAILDGDAEFLDYLCLENGADMILIPETSRLGSFYHLCLYSYTYGERALKLVYEKIAERSTSFGVLSMLALAPILISQQAGIVHLDNLPDGCRAYIDGVETAIVDANILTEAGQHTINLRCQGYQERALLITTEANTIISVDAKLNAIQYQNLLVNGTSGATVSVNGIELGQTPFNIQTYSLPLTIRLEKEGYAGRSIALSEPPSEQDLLPKINLKPVWMTDKGLFNERKNDFYWSMARTILLFGAKLVINSFNDGNNAVLTSLDALSFGALTVSVVDMVGSLIDYFRQTEYYISP